MAVKKGAGRPSLDPVDKFRRKVKRAKLNLEKMQTLAEVEAESGPAEMPVRRGRVPMTSQQRFEKEQVKFDKLLAELRTKEDEAGYDHCDLDAVEDPTVNELGLSTTGKPKADHFTILDRKLKKAKQKVEEAEAMEEVRNVKGGMGRPKISKAEKIRRAKIEVFTLEARILEEEGKLDEIGLQKRKLKRLRDRAHDARMKIKFYKKEGLEIYMEEVNLAAEMLQRVEETIDTEELRFKRLNEMKENFDEYDALEEQLKSLSEEEAMEQIKIMRKQQILKDELNRIRHELNATVDVDTF